jgi:sigma-B regulation protein RsbU (phosphoserine phosphatase)
MSLLRKTFPAFPERTELDIHAMVRPAREVGGDFYDFYFVDDDRLCLLLGDVSGKGIPAALFMAVTKTLLKANSSAVLSAGEIVGNVNYELSGEGDTGMFVTLLYALLNTATGEVELANAGHHPAFHVRANGTIAALSGESGVALGLVAGLDYPVNRVQLQPWRRPLFLYRWGDGGAQSRARILLADRLRTLLGKLHAGSADEINRAVVQDVRAFTADREQSDDISVLTLRWLGARSSLAAALANRTGSSPPGLLESTRCRTTPPRTSWL